MATPKSNIGKFERVGNVPIGPRTISQEEDLVFGDLRATFKNRESPSAYLPNMTYTHGVNMTLSPRGPPPANVRSGPSSSALPNDCVDFTKLAAGNKWMLTDGVWNVTDASGKYSKLSSKQQHRDNFLNTNKRCYSSGVAHAGMGNTTATDCNNYIQHCILNGDSGVCFNQISGGALNLVDAKNFVKSMHPYMALATLRRFGFHKNKAMIGGQMGWKSESVDEWFQKTQGWIGRDNSGRSVSLDPLISTHRAFLEYLNLISCFINDNPSILNGNMYKKGVGRLMTQKPIDAGDIQYWRAPPAQATTYWSGLLSSYGLARPFTARTFVAPPPYVPGMFGMMGGNVITLSGGDDEGMEGGAPPVRRFIDIPHGQPNTPGKFLAHLINQELNVIAQFNKSVAPNDLENINTTVGALLRGEQELVKFGNGLMNYSHQLRMSGGAADAAPEVLSRAEIENYYSPIKKHYGRVHKYTDRLTQILMELRKLTAGTGSSGSSSVAI